MGLWDKLKGELIDIIEWIDNSNGEAISHRFERRDNEIKNGAKLTVRESQLAVFINEGEFADIFMPGMYTLETQNIPILSTLKGWKHGFSSPFKAETYFFNTGAVTGLKWGTPAPVNLHKPGFGPIKYVANGTFVVSIDTTKDADGTYPGVKKFVRNIVKTDGEFTKSELKVVLREQLGNYLENALRTSLTQTASKEADDITVDRLTTSKVITEALKPVFHEWGLILSGFNIDVCDPDAKSQERLEKMGNARANKFENEELGINNEFLKYQNANNNKNIENPNQNVGNNQNGGGMMNNMMEAGIGMGMMGMMMNSMNQANQNVNQNNNNQTPPPPIPGQVAYFVAVNGQQAGPYNLQQLQQYVQAGQFKPDSMVWKQGMPAWVMANTIPELSNLFGAVPPPLPPQ